MAQKAYKRLVLFFVLALGSALVSAEVLKSVDKSLGDGSRHRRSLLAATQQISQCNWIAGEGCALHPAYASYALNKSSEDVVAQYVANALACSTATDKGLCEASNFCYWDPSFSNGQQGCFLQDDALLSLQLRCVQQQYVPSLTKLQACMAARQSCQCTTSTSNSISAAASCNQRQVALLTNFPGSSRDKVCGSLLGCWMSSLNSSSTDLTALVETQLLLVQPKLEGLSSASSEATTTTSSSSGGRRLLQIPPSLSDPVLDDKSSTSSPISPESGSYGSGTGSSSSAVGTPGVGMNGVVTEDQAASSVTTNTPVENGNNVPAPSKTNSSANSNTSAGLQLESGAVGSDWVLEAGPVDPDKVFGSSGGTAAGSSSSSSSNSDSSSVQMTGGNAPASFWQCAAAAAAKADTTRKWADVDYNSKQLTLAIWIRVIQPTALIDWGIQVLECFKTEVPKLSNLDASTNSTKPNKESLEFAIVTLIRAFSGQAEAFRAYLQAGATARPTAGLAALSRLVQDVFPSQLATLSAKQQMSPAYRRDVMLQAASVITDAQWFAADVRSLASASGDSTAQQEVFEAYINYAGESLRRCLYWLFYLTFDGPPAHLPGAIPSSAASSAVMAVFEGLAAAALPSRAVAADAAAWQQLMVMTATAAGHAAAAAAPYGADFDAGLALSNTVAGLAKAHVQDMWGTRLELARFGASATGRQLALYDPNEKSTRWEPLRRQQITMLAALQQRAALGASADGGAANERLANALRELVAASGAYLVASDSPVVQQQKQQELSGALGLSSRLALLIRQCYGSPAGLPALSAAAAAKAGIPASSAGACQQLAAQTEQLSSVGQGGVLGTTLSADIDRQWRCNAVPAGSCSSKPGCTLALAPVLVPAVAAAAADKLLLSCQASDSSLLLSSLDSSAKSALAAGSTCEQFLKLPACESISNAATCSSQSTCRWEATSQRNILHTAASASKAAAAAGSRGACAMDWVSVLSSTGGGKAYSSLNSMVQLCSGIADSNQCESQTMLITLDAPAPANASMARIWVPALVVAAVAGVLLFGAAIWWRRRSAAARRAAEEARTAAGGGRNSRRDGKGGKGGKGAKGTKKKPKRAEPGEYKPDLMRDSFTDYMRAAPQQFSNGVAIAKAAIATGDLDTAVAVADVAGGRQLAAMQQQSGANAAAAAAGAGAAQGPVGRALSGSDASSSWGLGVGPTGSVPRSQGSSDLIDLSQSDTSGHHGIHNIAAAAAGGFDALSSGVLGSGRVSPTGPTRGGPSAVWGSAAAAAGMGPELISPRSLGFNQPSPVAARPPLHGGLSVPMNLLDSDDSIALTSSINLVSSLPQHSSLPCGFVPPEQQQQYGGLQQQQAGQQMGVLGTTGGVSAALSAARAEFGASNGLQRTSGNSLASTAYGNRSFTEAMMQGTSSGSLLLPQQQHSRAGPASDDGCVTPNSSCCHDSVCTFGPGPGSVVSSVGGGASRAAGLRPQHSQGGVAGSTAAAAGGRGGAPGGAAAATGLSAAPSVPLSRSSWSSAVSTDLLMVTQNSSAILDP